MKKVIFVSGIQLFPPESGGQLRSANFCRSLVKLGYQVDIYSYTGRKSDYLKGKASARAEIESNLSEYVNRNFIFGIIQFVFYRLNFPPLWLTWICKLYTPKYLRKILMAKNTVILDFPYLFPLYKQIEGQLVVNTHNAEYELFSNNNIASRIKKIELESFKKANIVIFCNKQDQKKFEADYADLAGKSFILPNGVELANFAFNQADRTSFRKKYNILEDQKVFLFTGSRYLPNIEAYDFLIKWSQVNSQALIKSNIVILIAGTVCESTSDNQYLKVIGKVPDMMPIFWGSDFALNPITTGSGTNVKMFEFLAARLPILTTAFGARGLKLIDFKSCFYFENSNLLEKMIKATSLGEQEKREITKKALTDNQKDVDMTNALDSLSIKW